MQNGRGFPAVFCLIGFIGLVAVHLAGAIAIAKRSKSAAGELPLGAL